MGTAELQQGGWFFVFVGAAIVLTVPVHAAWRFLDVRWRWTVLSGTIVKTGRREIDGEDGPVGVFYPVIRVRLPDGETVQFNSEYTARTDPWLSGEVVRVCVRGDRVRHFDPWLKLPDYVGWALCGLGVALTGVLPPEH